MKELKTYSNKVRFTFYISLICFLIFSLAATAQEESDTLIVKGMTKKQIKFSNSYNPLSPSKAAFYSAIFPGGGQIYNKKYWKAPIVWAALGTSVYFYLDNNSEFKRYRRAFKQRQLGLQDEFTLDNGTTLISNAGLERAQRTLRDNRDFSVLTTIIIYVLQIVEASVNAHLLQFNDNDNLSVAPSVVSDPIRIETPKVGLRIKYSF